MRCAACGRKQLFENEGRFIDGTWAEDAMLPELKGAWVCCYACYRKLLSGIYAVNINSPAIDALEDLLE